MARHSDHDERGRRDYAPSENGSSSRRKHIDSGSGRRSDYRDHSPTQYRRSRSPPSRPSRSHRDYDSHSSRRTQRSRSRSRERGPRGRDHPRDMRGYDYDRYGQSERDRGSHRDRDYQGRDRGEDAASRRRDPDARPSSRVSGQALDSEAAAGGPTRLPARPPPSLPSRPAFLPPVPAAPSPTLASTTPGPSSPLVGSPNPASGTGTEDEKVRARRERLEAWKKEREAQKALEEAKLRAQSVAAAHGAAPTSLPAKPSNAPTTISVAGLKGLSGRADLGKGKVKGASATAMDDSADQPAKKQLKRLNLPPMDPLLKPGAGGKVGAGSDLEDGAEDDDDDEEDERQDIVPMQVDQDDDEEDPLDAFMSSIKDEVNTVNDADRKRSGLSQRKVVAPVIGEDDEADGETGAAEPDELDQARAEDIMALAAKKIKKKDIPTVDHSKVDYEPFRKDFYHPPSEVDELSEEDADRLRMELDAIKVRGKDCPKPLTKWSYCGLPASCLDVIKKLEYHSPTPIQAQAIPAIMSGRDMIGVAKTGSGKTMAFLLPMFRHIKDQRPVEKNEGPIGLIMTPTRELAVQIFRESKPFLKATGLRAVCVYGGAPISEQIAEMKKTADIVVATPGRMIDLLTANSGRVTNLLRVTYLVLDEADRMFDMGFEPQVMKIINNIRPDRQTVLFSATFPRQMESLARKTLRNRPLEITVGGRSVVAPEIEQIIEVREEDTKFNRLLEILGQTFNLDRETRALIFVDRQKAADELFKQLLSKGYTTMSLHGGQDQVDRDATISDFKAGDVDVVIATSIAARGIDVKQLKLVINYDAPNHMEDYVHRAGRTGRAGNKGTCVTFITPEQDRYARDIIAALKASKVAVPAELQALADSFQEKVKAGKAQAASSGFGGKGLERFESEREKALREQRSAYGEGEEGEGGAAAAGKEQPKGLDDIKVQRGPPPADDQLSGVRDMHIEVKKGAAPESIRDNKVKAEGDTEKPATPTAAGDTKAGGEADAAEAAKERAIAAAKASGANADALAQALAKINSLHQARQAQKQAELAEREREREKERERRPKDPDATDYHAIVPINDFPQKARWRCTNKETMSMLIADTGASITNKGVFYEKGKEPQPGEPPKLQLLIESNDEEKVETAVRMIKQILLEATQAALEAEQRNPPPGVGGRYNVV